MKTYINNSLDADLTLTGDVSGSVRVIGSKWGPCNSESYGPGTDSYGSVFSGYIGIIMVHNRALNTTEIAQNWNNLRSRFKI